MYTYLFDFIDCISCSVKFGITLIPIQRMAAGLPFVALLRMAQPKKFADKLFAHKHLLKGLGGGLASFFM